MPPLEPRRIALVMGAGASLANAAYFRPERSLDTHPPLDTTFFQKIRVRDVPLPPALRAYMRRLLQVDPTPRVLEQMRMEDFFKDLFYDFQSSPTSIPTRTAYTDLVNIYRRVLRDTTNWLCEDNRTGAPLGRLIAAAADTASHVSLVTFNHDLVIENEVYKRARLRTRWCVDKGYGSISDTMTLLRSGVLGADFPRHDGGCDHAHPISILKLHGSLNWIVRLQGRFPTARQLTGDKAQQDVLLSRRREIMSRLRYTRPIKGKCGKGRGRTSWYTWPVIIPPIYAKQSLIRSVQAAWAEARDDLQEAERVVFFGYSLPAADIEAEKLFQRTLSGNRELRQIEVINPDPASASRYATLVPKKSVAWYSSVEQFLSSSSFS
jgi:hypothetical protein